MKLQKWEKTNLIESYYRLKEFTEKSHRTIMKLAKEYEVYFHIPVLSSFG